VGLGTIAKLSREVVLVILGVHKRAAVKRLQACGDFDAQWPASIIYRCCKARLLMDVAAAGGA